MLLTTTWLQKTDKTNVISFNRLIGHHLYIRRQFMRDFCVRIDDTSNQLGHFVGNMIFGYRAWLRA